jgi:hypothetical protein
MRTRDSFCSYCGTAFTEAKYPRIIVLDEDQGKSAALPDARDGFGSMVPAMARGASGQFTSELG